MTTRLVAQKMAEKLGQSVIVDNRPGGDTLLGTRMVKDAPADGYTLLAQANGFTLLPFTKREPGYDPVKDFSGLGFMTRSAMILDTGAGQPDRTLPDLIARAKKEPLTFASGGTGGPPHIACAMFLQAAGVNMLHVPYKGNGAALPDVVADRVNMICDGYISSAAFLQSGRLRALAVTSPERIAPLPNVPTFVEQGVNYTYSLWLGLLVKAGTPKDVVQKLSDALHYALTSKELSERFRSEGSDPSFVTPQAFDQYLAKEYSQMAKVASDLKLPRE
ncbi:tripartite tricarboxylate transporter substrate binding protein [Rhodoferax sediminis]|uniref:Tripartite tricarboxylate transporter substrate binding protein n=2 Tax=Rhodoferax sediminis TaxID=2509614 RepID=A0A515DHI5_9BURK|nr:tripartite tricarboxylate transporter substrate binding protein [Rhodoferax sediminis]